MSSFLLIIFVTGFSVAQPREKKMMEQPRSDSIRDDRTTLVNSIGMEFVFVELESPQPSRGNSRAGEDPDQTSAFWAPFYIGKYEVTQQQWRALMGKNPSRTKEDRLPVESVFWEQVQEFIGKLNAREAGDRYRLPTVAEWEYAARG